MSANWTENDLRSVTYVTIGNGLWLGFVAWLVLGLCLELFTFIPIWIISTLISWIVAIYRQYTLIEIRECINEDITEK